MTAEPVCFDVDADGRHHLPFDDLPRKALIDIHNLARLIGVKVMLDTGKITIECDGRTLIYDRVGVTLEGVCVCRLRASDA